MLWAGSEPGWRLYVGVNAICVRHRDQVQWRQSPRGYQHTVDDIKAFVASEEDGRRRWRRPVLDVLLSGALARPCLLDPISGAKDLEEEFAISRSLAPEKTGLDANALVWMQTNHKTTGSRLAVCAPQELIQWLGELSLACGLRLRHIVPWWAEVSGVARSQAPEARMLAVEDSDSLTWLMESSEGDLYHARTQIPVPSEHSVQANWKRAEFNDGVLRGQQVMSLWSEGGRTEWPECTLMQPI